MTDQASPFTLGAEVAIVQHGSFRGVHYTKVTVSKVTPTGRFKVRYAHGYESSTTWKPELKWTGGSGGLCDLKQEWRAEPVGEKYSREHAVIWDAEVQAKVEKQAALSAARQVYFEVLERVKKGWDVTTPEGKQALDEISAILKRFEKAE